MNLDLSNPIVVIVGGVILLGLVVFWNRHNAKVNRNRRRRSFRENYYNRKKEREKENN